jgi:hypothetical protein
MKIPSLTLFRGMILGFMLCFSLLSNTHIYGQIDLVLEITATEINPSQYSNISVTTTVTNFGVETATEVVVEVPISDLSQIVYSGGNEFTASQGSFYPYGTEIWEVGDLAPDESATLTTNYFVLEETQYELYSQVLNANEDDPDSTPNNGTPPNPNEDDEAALIFNDSNSGNCDLSFMGIEAICDNNGTPNDPNDDQWFAHINPTGTGLGATFSITGNITANNLAYGQNYTFGPYPIDPFLNIAFTITDDEFGCAESFILVQSGACSTGTQCQISAEILSVECSQKGTPNDPSDDTWGFVINVTGDNNSNNWIWELPGGNSTLTGLYDNPTLYTNNPLTGLETLQIDIRDVAEVNCTTSISVDAPFPCVASDLSDVELSMNSTSAGGAFVVVSFDIQVTNTGNSDASGLQIRVPVPEDAVPQGGNEFSTTAGIVGGFNTWIWQLATLSPGQTETLTVNYFTLSDAPITGYAEVVAMIGDDEDSTPNNGTPPIPNEDDEAAFTIGGVPNLPDLTVSNLVQNLPPSLELETDYQIFFDLNNIGSTLAVGDFRIGLYLSLDDNFDSGTDILVGEVMTGNIANTTPINAAIRVEDTTPSQDYFLLIVADDMGDITELNEDNNTLASNNEFTVFNPNDGCTGLFLATTQAELDQFPQGCTTWAGSIELNGDITDLSPLSNLNIILGNLIFEECAVTDFSPLSGLKEAGTLFFYFNPNMTNLNGLPANIETRSIQVIGNPSLTSLDGMPTVTTQLDNLTIANNASLASLEGLSGIAGDHPDMVLVVDLNPQLTSLSGLENITQVNTVSIASNENLTDCCPIFELLNSNNYNNTNIQNNESGCNSVTDILASCGPSSCQITVTIIDIECQNQGTLDDSVDDTYTARILVEGNAECSGNFLVDGNFGGIFGSQAIFGAQATLGPFLISDGNVSVEITDSDGNNGVTVLLEAPAACSNGANPDECGFENTYPPLTELVNLRSQTATETTDGYELEMFGNTIGDPLFTYYDVSIGFDGMEVSNTQTIMPVNGFKRVESGDYYAKESVSTTELRLRRLNNAGVTLWENIYTFDTGGPQGNPDARDVIEVSDGVVFLIQANGPTDNSWLLKTDFDGNLIYNKHFQEEDGFLQYQFEGQAQNGDFLIFRQSSSRTGFLIRATADGDLIYQESIVGDLVTSRIGGFDETPDGNFIYASYRNQLTPQLEKLDAFTGERIWALNLSNTFSPNNDMINSGEGDVLATEDGGAVVGYPFFPTFGGGDPGYEYGKINADGLAVWWQQLPNGYDLDAELETSDGGFLFAGDVDGIFGVVKTTSQGLLTPICSNNPLTGMDLELKMTTTNTNPSPYTFFSVTLELSNKGSEHASGIVVDFPLLDELTFQGGNEFSASQGTYSIYGNQQWNVGNLAVGQTATLTVNYFVLGIDKSLDIYAQVIAHDASDVDSSPNNGTPPTVNEDDEAVLTINIPSLNVLGSNEGFTFNVIPAGDYLTELIWTHNHGTEVKNYAVEHSADGQNFETLSVYEPIGKNGYQVYQTHDLEPISGNNFYRIRIENLDGTTVFSEVKSVYFLDVIDFSLFPNPANKFVKVNLEAILDFENIEIEIYNNLGVLVFEKDISKVNTPYNQLDLRGLQDGFYTVYLKIPNRKPIAKRLMIGRM